jgi:hypothetical protein
MTQISRPFQIVLVAFVLFVGVWFLALHGHTSTSTGGSGSSAPSSSSASDPSSPAPSTATKAKTTASVHSTRVAHVSDGTSTVTVKHSASTVAGHATVTHTTIVTKHTTVAKPAPRTTVAHTTVVTHTSTTKPAPKATPATGTPAQQATVEHQLQQGKTVLILFWNPRGADDVAVHKELPAVQHALGGKIAVDYASASQVGSFGTVTHAIQVTQTPTLLIVNPHGQTTVLTGLTDAFSIEQTVGEANE